MCRLLGLRRPRRVRRPARPVDVGGPGRAGSEAATSPVRIGLIGKYVNLPDAYLSVVEALRHGGLRPRRQDRPRLDPGRGRRGPAGRRPAQGSRRDRHPRRVRRAGHRGQDRGGRATPGSTRFPASGCASGLQVMVIDYARNVAGPRPAPTPGSSTPPSPHPVIDLMDEQREVVDMGGTMRLGAYIGQAGARLGRWPRLRRRRWCTSGTATATRSTPATAPGWRRPAWCCSGTLARRPAGRVHRAARPPVLGRHPGPPGVQEPAGPSPPAVRGPGRRRPGAGRGPGAPPARHRRSCRRSVSSARPRSCAGTLIQVAAAAASKAPTGSAFERDIVHHPGAVVVVPLTADADGAHGPPVPGRHRRRAARDSRPASATSHGEPTEVTAARELAEEVGRRAGRLDLLARFYNSPGFSDELSWLYLARDLDRVPDDRQGAEEQHMTDRGGAARSGARPDRRRARSSTPSRSSGSASPRLVLGARGSRSDDRGAASLR